MSKTPEEIAYEMLEALRTDFRMVSGEFVRGNNLYSWAARTRLRGTELSDALHLAIERGWIEEGAYQSFRFTDSGYRESLMKIARFCRQSLTLVKKDGSQYSDLRGQVSGDKIVLLDGGVHVQPGDVIENRLTNGHLDRLYVLDADFHGEESCLEPHYQIKCRREGAPTPASTNIINSYGAHARNYLHSSDHSQNHQAPGIDLIMLAQELRTLQRALEDRAASSEQFAALGILSAAERAADANDQDKANGFLTKLGSVGSWVLGVAKDAGTDVAAEAIKKVIGLS